MSVITNNIRRQEKATATTTVIPTIPPNEDHTSGLWISTDIYERELFINLTDKKIFTRVGSTIVQLGMSLSGNGFVKVSGSTVSYDNSTYLTTISGIVAGGELAGTYPNPTLLTSAVTGKLLTGLSVAGGTVISTDSILIALGKLQNQANAVVGAMDYQGTWNANTNSPTLVTSTGTKGFVYRVTVSGSTNIDGITDWKAGDFIVFNGATWDKWDSTDAVTSVNGYVGNVTLVAADISAWGLSGNSVVDDLQFIGTTNNHDFLLKTNNTTVVSFLKTGQKVFTGTSDITQFVIKANSTQSNSNPIIKIQKSDGTDYIWISSDSIYNTFIGLNAGAANTISGGNNGLGNTFIGSSAGTANTTGNQNVFIGTLSGTSNTTGLANNSIGQQSLNSNTTGFHNNSFGTAALFSNITGNYNSAFGDEAAKATTSSYNSAFGYQALHVSTGQYNTAVGALALSSVVSGTSNTALGLEAGQNALGSGNVFLGSQSGDGETGSNKLYIDNQSRGVSEAFARTQVLVYGVFDSTVANQTLRFNANVGVGVYASSTRLQIQGTGTTSSTFGLKVQNSASVLSLIVNDEGSVYNNGGGNTANNTAFGLESMIFNTVSGGATAYGYQTLKNNTSGDECTAIGYIVLKLNTSGINNTGVGSQALAHNVTSNNNTAIGYQSLEANTGNHNTAIGSGSLQLNNSGVQNFAGGYQSLRSTNGDNNVGVGNNSGYSNTTGSNNAFIGAFAGYHTIGDGNVCIGFEAGNNQTTSSNKLFIDNQDRGSAGNDLTKSMFYGIFDSVVANQKLYINAGIINFDDLQTGNAGLSSGDLYKDTAANIFANSDYVVGMKA